jgi:Rieske Fe-S protein
LDPSREQPRVPAPSLWPVGLALGVVVLVVGVAMGWWIVALGAILVLVFGALWVRDVARSRGLEEAGAVEAERRAAAEPEPEYEPAVHATTYTREKFLEASTLGLGALIGAAVTLPVLGFAVIPPFLNQGHDDKDVGPLDLYPEGEWRVATFPTHPEAGTVSLVSVFIRYNGLLEQQPSFTVLSSHCVHLGCPVQPNGLLQEPTRYEDVTLIATEPTGFGCPCHGGQYDNEGNRTAGPPVRALDRYSFAIRDGNLYLGTAFSVGKVDGTGANARIYSYPWSYPGVHVDGPESWLYPIQPPSS